MLKVNNQILNISELETIALKFSRQLNIGDIIFLQGELGAGKTTFSRFIINCLYKLNKKTKPKSISSPTYPILLTYNLSAFEIYHYDLYRIKNISELEEIDFFENISNSITLIEWPEILIDLPFEKEHYHINLHLHSESKRIINIKYFK